MRNCNKECIQNQNLLTNFNKELKPLYEEAIRRYGKEDVFITDDAYWYNGVKDNSMYALRCKIDKDYSEFWHVLEMIKKSWDTKLFSAMLRVSLSGVD